MTNDEFMKSILKKLNESTDDARKELSEFRAESRRDLINIRANLADSNLIQVRQQAILEDHIRRTEVNEEELALLKIRQAEDIKILSAKIEPLEEHVFMWAGAGKVLIILGVIGTILGGIAKFIWH